MSFSRNVPSIQYSAVAAGTSPPSSPTIPPYVLPMLILIGWLFFR